MTAFEDIRRVLRDGDLVGDGQFDEVYPAGVRQFSRVHWTPVHIAARAAYLLSGRGQGVFLEGVGKFCIVAAATVAARVRGVEHRAGLVDIARAAASRVGVDVEFVHATLDDEDPSAVNGVYLFNPFADNVSSPCDHVDETVERGQERFGHLASLERFLRAARAGTRVVTYGGLGGSIPNDYVLAVREHYGATLELWIKRH